VIWDCVIHACKIFLHYKYSMREWFLAIIHLIFVGLWAFYAPKFFSYHHLRHWVEKYSTEYITLLQKRISRFFLKWCYLIWDRVLMGLIRGQISFPTFDSQEVLMQFNFHNGSGSNVIWVCLCNSCMVMSMGRWPWGIIMFSFNLGWVLFPCFWV